MSERERVRARGSEGHGVRARGTASEQGARRANASECRVMDVRYMREMRRTSLQEGSGRAVKETPPQAQADPTPRQKGLKTVFDEAIRAVLAPSDRGAAAAKKKKKKACVIL